MIDYGTVYDGPLRTDTVNSSGISIDMEKRTADLFPANYTTRTMIKLFGKTVIAKDMEHKYRERRPIPHWTSIAVVDAAAAGHIEVADPTYIKDDHVLWIIRDGVILEQLLVQDASIDATVDVVQFHGTTGTGGIQNATEVGDIVIIGPEAHAEGEAVPEAYTNVSVDKRDYLMQIDRAVKKTDIEANIAHYDSREKKLAMDMKVAWVEENAKLNLALYLAEETLESTSASRRRYAFHGLFQRLTENVENFGGVGSGFTRQALQEIIRKTKDEAPAGGMKVLVAGVNINNHISSWPDGSIRVDPNSTKWGIRVRTIQTQYDTVAVVYDNVLTARHGLDDRGIVLDSRYVRQMYLNGLKMRAFMRIEGNRDIHNMEHAISGTWGVQTKAVESMAQIKGVN